MHFRFYRRWCKLNNVVFCFLSADSKVMLPIITHTVVILVSDIVHRRAIQFIVTHGNMMLQFVLPVAAK